MKTFLFLILTVCFNINAMAIRNIDVEPKNSSYNIPILNFDEIEHLFHQSNDSIYVINFWATWCSPCVQEIPYFEAINQKYSKQKVKVILISLDFKNQYESRLLPFVKARQLNSSIIMLDDPRSNMWIPKVSPNWTGSIPATVIYNKNKRMFYEKVFTFEELETEILIFLNQENY